MDLTVCPRYREMANAYANTNPPPALIRLDKSESKKYSTAVSGTELTRPFVCSGLHGQSNRTSTDCVKLENSALLTKPLCVRCFKKDNSYVNYTKSKINNNEPKSFSNNVEKVPRAVFRKTRTVITDSQLRILEDFFINVNAFPTSEDYYSLSRKSNLENKVMRVCSQINITQIICKINN